MSKFDDLINMAVKLGYSIEAEEKKRSKAAAVSRKAGKKKRQPGVRKFGEDTYLTSKLLYKIMDRTDKTVHYVAGIGAAEKLVEGLKTEEHNLVLFTTNTSGDKLVAPKHYQCIVSSNGKAGYASFFRPTTEWRRAKIHNKDGAPEWGLIQILPWPIAPGGFYFLLKDIQGGEKEVIFLSQRKVIVAGPYRVAEEKYLQELSKGDRLVIEDILDDRALLDAVELVLNCHFSELSTRRALDILRKGTTRYAHDPTEIAEGSSRAQRDQQTIENQQTVIDRQAKEIERLSLIVTQQLGIIQGLGETTA